MFFFTYQQHETYEQSNIFGKSIILASFDILYAQYYNASVTNAVGVACFFISGSATVRILRFYGWYCCSRFGILNLSDGRRSTQFGQYSQKYLLTKHYMLHTHTTTAVFSSRISTTASAIVVAVILVVVFVFSFLFGRVYVLMLLLCYYNGICIN